MLEIIKTPEVRSKKEKTFLKTPVNQNRNNRNKENKRNYRNNKKLKANKLTIDEQIACFAEIICTQLLKEMNLYEKD